MSTRDFSFISFSLLPFSAKMPAMHWFKLSKKSVSFTTATFFSYIRLSSSFHSTYLFGQQMKRIVGAVAASDAAAVAAINIQHKTSTFQTPFSFCTFYAVRMKVFYHFFCSCCRWVWVCVLITCTMCALVPNHTHRKTSWQERRDPLACHSYLAIPAIVYCDGIVKKCNMIQGIDAYEKCSYIWYN